MEGIRYVCLDCCEEFDQPHERCPACGEEMSPDARVPAGVRYGVFQILTTCQRCGQPLPLNGPLREVTCNACSSVNSFPPDTWKNLLEDFEEEYPAFRWASSCSSTMMMGAGTFEVTYGKQVPHCPHCHKVLASFDLPAGTDRDLVCRKCEAPVPTFPAPGWLREVLPTAVQLYGAQREAGPAPAGAVEAAGADAARPVVMQCPQCGGALRITAASERLVPCEYCQVDVYLPDEVWRRLHPVKTADRWMVRFEGPRPGAGEQQDQVDTAGTAGQAASLESPAPRTRPSASANEPAGQTAKRTGGTRAFRYILLALMLAALLAFLALWGSD